MTDPVETVLEARDGRQTSIGFDDAFVTIGKRINPTNRKVLTQQLKGGDMTLARRDARRQMEAGAQVIDVNVGFAGADEPIVMPMAVRASMEEVGTCRSLSIRPAPRLWRRASWRSRRWEEE